LSGIEELAFLQAPQFNLSANQTLSFHVQRKRVALIDSANAPPQVAYLRLSRHDHTTQTTQRPSRTTFDSGHTSAKHLAWYYESDQGEDDAEYGDNVACERIPVLRNDRPQAEDYAEYGDKGACQCYRVFF